RPSLAGFGNQSPIAARELADGSVMVVSLDNAGLTAIRYDHAGAVLSSASFYPPYGLTDGSTPHVAIDPFGAVFFAASSNLCCPPDNTQWGDAWLMKYDGISGSELWDTPGHYDAALDYIDTPDQLLIDATGDAIVVISSRPSWVGQLKNVVLAKFDG